MAVTGYLVVQEESGLQECSVTGREGEEEKNRPTLTLQISLSLTHTLLKRCSVLTLMRRRTTVFNADLRASL